MNEAKIRAFLREMSLFRGVWCQYSDLHSYRMVQATIDSIITNACGSVHRTPMEAARRYAEVTFSRPKTGKPFQLKHMIIAQRADLSLLRYGSGGAAASISPSPSGTSIGGGSHILVPYAPASRSAVSK